MPFFQTADIRGNYTTSPQKFCLQTGNMTVTYKLVWPLTNAIYV